MSFSKKIFKAYDIRGVYPDELDEKIAYRTAVWFADMRKRELGQNKITLVVGCDMRLSSPMIFDAVVRGLVEQGVNVIDVGLISTPSFYFAVAGGDNGDGVVGKKLDGGMMITASHNPAEYSGIKLVRTGAVPVSGETGIMTLRDLVETGELPEYLGDVGKVFEKTGIAGRAVQKAFDFVGVRDFPEMKIVIDTANSMGALDMDVLFEQLNCELVRMNWELDGTFPAHEADPFKSENCEQLCEKVVASGADLGIAFDGDADRVFFVNENGEVMSPVALRSLLSKIMLVKFPKAKILYDVRPGKITSDVILDNGGEPVLVRVGHSFFKEKMLEIDAKFGGESSGHFFVKFDYGAFESPVTIILLLLAEMARTGNSLSVIENEYKKYAHSGEINFVVKDVGESLEKIVEHFKGRGSGPERLDGVSFDLGDVWFNLRGSNTEPKIRLNVEGESVEVVEGLVGEVRGVLG